MNVIYDFSPDSGLDIKGNVILRIYLEMIRAVSLKDPAHFVQVYIASLMILQKEVGFEKAYRFMEALTRYLLSARGDIDFEEVKRKLQAKSLEGSEILMTIAERLIKEGKKQEKIEIALAALKKGYSIDDIAEITGLDKKAILELKEKDS